jgi:ABC-type dipeptide/oligopeptide/nickel transport system permease subunit
MRLILLSLTLIVLASILGPWLSPYSLSEVSAARLAPPSFSHWLGTDLHGRDLLTRLLYGGRISLLVGLVGATVSLLVGVTYGLISGYLGGRTDNAMMRFVDILYALIDPRVRYE